MQREFLNNIYSCTYAHVGFAWTESRHLLDFQTKFPQLVWYGFLLHMFSNHEQNAMRSSHILLVSFNESRQY